MRLPILVLALLVAAAPALAGLPEGIAAMERRDYAAAMRELRPLADAGDAEAAYRIGMMQREGLGMAADPAAAVANFRRAAEKGHVRAALMLGAMYVAGEGVRRDGAQGLVWLRRAAEGGDAQAQMVVGAVSEAGEGGRRDMAAAIGWYRKAAAQGEALAMLRLARIYREGRGVAKDDRAATDWLRQAAERGHRDGQFEYALALSRGTGVPRDAAAAAAWWRRAAEAGHPESQINLAVVSLKGDGVPADPAAALAWYRRAAAQGHPQAQAGLADLLQRGLGAPADPAQAYYWFGVAARRFPKGAARDAARKSQAALGRQLDAAERAALDRRIRAFRAKPEGEAAGKPPAPSRDRRGAAAERAGTGTGFFVDKSGHVLTNAHVVEACATIRVTTAKGAIPAQLVARDEAVDLAVLRVESAPAAVASFRSAPAIRAGDGVVLVGYPLSGILAAEPNVTTGAVSALAGLRGDARHLQLTAPAQPGNSGGPLLDMTGRVVGVLTSSLATRGGRSAVQNVNFAIKAEVAQDFLRAQGVTPEAGRAGRRMEPADVGAIGAKIAVPVECRG